MEEQQIDSQENQEQPQQNPPQEPKKKLDKKTWGLVVLAVAVVVLVIVVIQGRDKPVRVISFEECVAVTGVVAESYPRQCFLDGQSFIEDISDPVVDDVVNWKTYRNEEFGFEVSYPPEWEFDPKTTEGFASNFLDIHLRSPSEQFDYPSPCTDGFIGMEIQAGRNLSLNQVNTLEELIIKETAVPNSYGINARGNVEKLLLGQNKVSRVEHSGWVVACPGPGYYIDQNNGSFTYVFSGMENSQDVSMVEEILSSIKFID